MPEDANGPVTGSEGQPVNAPSAPQDNAISALSRYRAQQAASAPATQDRGQGGAVGPETDATPRPEREPYIPRERFDEVNTKLKGEVETLKQQLAMLQQRQPQFGPAPTQVAAQPGVTGMIGAAPAPTLPDFNDPAVKKQWSDRIYKDPVGGLTALVEALIEARGTPLLQQFQQQITAQLTPLQQQFLQSQLGAYEQRAASDPTFHTIRPTFDSLVREAVNRSIPLTEQTLRAIEGIARAQHNLPFGTPATPPAPAPFTERPGGQGMTQRPQTHLTQTEREFAGLFKMSDEEYAGWFARNGVER